MAYLKITGIQSFQELSDWMEKGSRQERAREERVLGYHTVARRTIESSDIRKHRIAIRQWNTDIYVLDQDNIATLNVGDWFTVTTKQRLNDLLPPGLSIYSEKGRWIIQSRASIQMPIPFWNGIRIDVTKVSIVADVDTIYKETMMIVEQDQENAVRTKIVKWANEHTVAVLRP